MGPSVSFPLPLRIALKLPARNSWELIIKKLPIPLPIFYFFELTREKLANTLYFPEQESQTLVSLGGGGWRLVSAVAPPSRMQKELRIMNVRRIGGFRSRPAMSAAFLFRAGAQTTPKGPKKVREK